METGGGAFDLVGAEREVLAFWRERDVFGKSLGKNPRSRAYAFYDGPPFATGLPHHGHLLAGTIKDIIPRYQTMRGRYVERRFGWDCHGLPVEHEIDKKLGMSAQEAVGRLGVAGYNRECRSIVDRYVDEWERTVARMGRWVDFENDYKTMDRPFMESVWWVFRRLWDKGLVYRGTRVVPFSTALGTVLSNFEASQNYKDVRDEAVTVLFPLEGEDASLAVWTTTAWSLPANLALCVGPEIDYAKVRDKGLGRDVIMAQARLPAYGKGRDLEVLASFKGEALEGRRYAPLFGFFAGERARGAFRVLTDGYVTTRAGTGVVSIAPAFGEDDERVAREAGIGASACPVDDAGRFTGEAPPYRGLHVKEAEKAVIGDIEAASRLYERAHVTHSYPFCYRSDTPLIYKAIPSWYVRVTAIKDRILACNDRINWTPGHIKDGRFGKWLAGAKDWSISRNRVWGTPLPVWENAEDGKRICVGSVEELERLTGARVGDLHRDAVDHLEFRAGDGPGTYRRVPEVLDCWFESGSMPYAQAHYPFENKEAFERSFPAEFISEGIDQTRGWFYTLTVLSTALFDKPAFKNAIVSGMVMAHDGKKMSKRLKNYTEPDRLMETHGADALRLYLVSGGLVRGEEQRFSDDGVKEMARRVLLPWYNAFKFFRTYAEVDGWRAGRGGEGAAHVTDRWILSELETLKGRLARDLDSYRLQGAAASAARFIDNLTNWHIRLNRGRFWGEGLDGDKARAFSTLHEALLELSTLMAPFTPFLAEHVHRGLGPFGGSGGNSAGEESVHLRDWPGPDASRADRSLEESMGRMQRVVLLGRRGRAKAGVKVKIPLPRAVVVHRDEAVLRGIRELEPCIKSELNVKEVAYEKDEGRFVRLKALPNLPELGRRLGPRTGRVAALVRAMPPDAVAKVEAGGSVVLDGERLGGGDVLVVREPAPGSEAMVDGDVSLVLDAEPTEDLLLEGLAREAVARIQRTRREMGLSVDDRIHVRHRSRGRLLEAIRRHGDRIGREVLALTIEEAPAGGGAAGAGEDGGERRFDVEGEPLGLLLKKA